MKKAEFICPDCGSINKIDTAICREKYHEYQVCCQRCNHLLEIVVADGLGEQLNVIASSLDDDSATN
ncbi:hypothetical protein [Alteromonas flava]|uniref:hypothetical protein n=1 Tax=Alteromonas flava TaxID=2048003 RepID=UPI000F5F382D|nr:hypothetical protein [Alteromonas flava]